MKNGHGGNRRGAGKKPGTKWPSTLVREIQRKAYHEAIMARLQPLVTSQVELALGSMAVVAVAEMTPKGLKLRRVTDEQELEAIVTEGRGHRIALISPNVDMSKYVTDQALGRSEGASTTTVTTEGGKTIVKHEHLG